MLFLHSYTALLHAPFKLGVNSSTEYSVNSNHIKAYNISIEVWLHSSALRPFGETLVSQLGSEWFYNCPVQQKSQRGIWANYWMLIVKARRTCYPGQWAYLMSAPQLHSEINGTVHSAGDYGSLHLMHQASAVPWFLLATYPLAPCGSYSMISSREKMCKFISIGSEVLKKKVWIPFPLDPKFLRRRGKKKVWVPYYDDSRNQALFKLLAQIAQHCLPSLQQIWNLERNRNKVTGSVVGGSKTSICKQIIYQNHRLVGFLLENVQRLTEHVQLKLHFDEMPAVTAVSTNNLSPNSEILVEIYFIYM